VKRFRGRLVFKAQRLLYHSTLGSRVKTKKTKNEEDSDPTLMCLAFVMIMWTGLAPWELCLAFRGEGSGFADWVDAASTAAR
jgi:hypothetical protein